MPRSLGKETEVVSKAFALAVAEGGGERWRGASLGTQVRGLREQRPPCGAGSHAREMRCCPGPPLPPPGNCGNSDLWVISHLFLAFYEWSLHAHSCVRLLTNICNHFSCRNTHEWNLGVVLFGLSRCCQFSKVNVPIFGAISIVWEFYMLTFS